ncbi:RNA polymerase I-specific transcription initiation factor RRN6-like protein [Lipomyces kononenkoae]|uniref:RNA polymerase I-specific transcription initiation factor RRN6-like protein n=1 Tax=Lipomyces kononenkoae TaxID=34357 RepID=A0ACC3T0I8_LIPKO
MEIADRILGLKFAGTEYSHSAGALLSVRTARDCKFYRPGIVRSDESRKQLLTADLLASVSPPTETQEFSDIAFNPWYYQQFGTVDACGNWAIADLNEAQTKVTAFTSGSTNKDTDIMQWHSIQWGANLNNVIVSNSKIIQSLDLRAKAAAVAEYSPRLISNIRHVQPIPEKSNELFVLTSEDLVWMDLRMFPKELLAWRHYRDAADDSLRCSAFSVDSNSYAVVHSSCDPVVACYQFGTQERIPFSMEDPYIISCKNGSKLLDLMPVPVNVSTDSEELEAVNFLSIFELSMDYRLSQRIYCSDAIAPPRSIELEVASSDTAWEVNDPVRFDSEFTNPFLPRLVNFHPLYERIFPAHDETLVTSSNADTGSELRDAARLQVMSDKSSGLVGTLHDMVPSSGVVGDLQSFSESLDALCMDLSNKGCFVDDLGFENLPYVGDRSDTQGIYETILDKWLHPLPIVPRSSHTPQDALQDEQPFLSVPAKVRVRRERIARKIATDLKLESRLIRGTETLANTQADGSSAEVALNTLSRYVKYRKPTTNESSNTSLLASDWTLGNLV